MNKIFKNKWIPLLVILFFTPFLLSFGDLSGVGSVGCLFLSHLVGSKISDSSEDYQGSICGHAYLPDSDNHSGINVSLEGTSYSCITNPRGYFYISGFLDATLI